MAAVIRKMSAISSTILFLIFLITPGVSDRIKKKIYIDLHTQSACFRILNGTHEVGCTSSMKGNVGTIHYIQDETDYDWILSKGPHDPYIALLHGANFTGPAVRRLYKSDRVVGILVINFHNESIDGDNPWPEDGFSSQEKCPNHLSDMYSDKPEYKNCKKGDWNVAGSSLGRENIDIPIFSLSTEKDVDNVLNKCYFPFNHDAKVKSTGFPVCAAEMKSRMDGAVDSRSCRRRSEMFVLSLSQSFRFCDPLGDHNVVSTLAETDNSLPRKNDSVILVAARVDTTTLFLNEYKSADTSVAGIVTLLASAEALWKVKDVIHSNPNAKDVMYTFFQGETFDYIGSSRMVYEMNNGDFPPGPTKPSSKTRYLPKMDLSKIDQIVEVNQVGRRDDGDSLWAHTDPLGRSQILDKVNQMISSLQSFSQAANVTIQVPADKDMPLPPASAQSFLKHRLDIPTVVLTDHQKEYTNKYYASRFDSAHFIHADDYPADSNASVKYDYVTKQAQMISDMSTSLARYLYKASTGQEPSDDIKGNLTADPSTVTHLLYCFLVSPNCELFKESVDEKNVKSLTTAKAPFPFYVSVYDRHISEVTQLTYALMTRFTGQRLDVKKSKCKRPSGEKRYNYVWMAGAKKPGKGDDREGWCFRTTTFYTKAYSPAFDIDGYDMSSGEYSTWTESVWGRDAFGVRLFLIPSPDLQAWVLVVGLLMLALSMPIVYFLYSRSDLLFSPYTPSRSSPHRRSYNAMM